MAWIGGVVLGLIVSVPARRAVIYYSEHSLPPKYTGPKIRVYSRGAVRVFDPATQSWGAELA